MCTHSLHTQYHHLHDAHTHVFTCAYTHALIPTHTIGNVMLYHTHAYILTYVRSYACTHTHTYMYIHTIAVYTQVLKCGCASIDYMHARAQKPHMYLYIRSFSVLGDSLCTCYVCSHTCKCRKSDLSFV